MCFCLKWLQEVTGRRRNQLFLIDLSRLLGARGDDVTDRIDSMQTSSQRNAFRVFLSRVWIHGTLRFAFTARKRLTPMRGSSVSEQHEMQPFLFLFAFYTGFDCGVGAAGRALSGFKS